MLIGALMALVRHIRAHKTANGEEITYDDRGVVGNRLFHDDPMPLVRRLMYAAMCKYAAKVPQ